MASGVLISDEVVQVYNNMKVRSHGTDEKERYKLLLMCLSEDQKSIIVDHKSSLKVKDVEGVQNVFQKVVSMLPPKDCCYGLYDCNYETKESQKEDLIFIYWAPEDAPLKKKMVSASSKVSLKSKFTGVKFEWQLNDVADKEMCTLVDKLGAGKVKSIEGIKV
ncbi:non-muscle cofilin 1-like [Clarias gariepinus]|uniref:non-muscle cofilin 1-like n=1 Tax=Clarias gariepinus TaxID=13013 RepID=UPI00234D4DD2|nr:non-muscle cofilin 1-like [Clarias gariepinus]